MTTAAAIEKSVNRGYVDVYLKRRYPDGTYDDDWIDVTRFVTAGADAIEYALDSRDYDVGFFTASNLGITFDNKKGKFSDPLLDTRSLWTSLETRQLSKMKVEAGYLDDNDDKIPESAFEGFIDEREIRSSVASGSVSMTVFSKEFLFQSVTVPAGTLSSSVSASEAIFVLCSRKDILDHITVSAANINPDNDITIDNPGDFSARKLSDVLSDIMLATNSVMYLDASGNLIVKSRSHKLTPSLRLYKGSPDKPDNIYRIAGYNNGRHRVKNVWQWQGVTTLVKSEQRHLTRYGESKKTVSLGFITDSDTRNAILTRLRDEWQFPKREIEVTTDYLANEVAFYDLVLLDIRPSLSRLHDLPICGEAVAGEASLVDYDGGVLIEPYIGFKVIEIRHDLAGEFTTTLKLREKGTQLNDGYVMGAPSKTVAVTFSNDSSKDIDVAPYGFDAQRCKVEILDTADDHKTNDFEITRPDANTIRLTAGMSISGSFRALIVETEE